VKIVLIKDLSEEKFDVEGINPLLAPEGGSGFAEARLILPWWLDFIYACKESEIHERLETF
jgi:hypothetical protein